MGFCAAVFVLAARVDLAGGAATLINRFGRVATVRALPGLRLLMRHALALGLTALVLIQGTAAAHAQTKRGGPKAASAADAPAPSADDEVARGLFQAGKAAYEAGKYEDALSFFEQAHARSGRPQLLFNIGQAADRLRRDEKALEAFRAYLAQVPDAANRIEVEARVRQLELWVDQRSKDTAPIAPIVTAPTPAETAEQAPATTSEDPAFTESDRPESEPVTSKWWFWTGIGAVVVGGTAVALAVALGGDETEPEPFYEGNGGSLKGP
jgi:tetratricopeptide (TPR) repeat protein